MIIRYVKFSFSIPLVSINAFQCDMNSRTFTFAFKRFPVLFAISCETGKLFAVGDTSSGT